MKIEVVPAASEQVPVLANLLQLYAHDFSEFHDLEIGADGSFVYEHLPLYWSEPGRPPFLVWVDNELGFVLVKKGSETSGNGHVWDMAEFFVLRAYRRRRVGTRIAYEVWKRFPGVCEVRVMQANAAALNFWTRAISEFTGKNIDPCSLRKRRGELDALLLCVDAPRVIVVLSFGDSRPRLRSGRRPEVWRSSGGGHQNPVELHSMGSRRRLSPHRTTHSVIPEAAFPLVPQLARADARAVCLHSFFILPFRSSHT